MEILYKVEDFTFEDKKQALQFEEIISNNKFYFKQKKERNISWRCDYLC